MEGIIHLIDEGSKKFKYGLLWHLIFRSIGNSSDYHYQDLLTLTDDEIHDILKPHIEISQYYKSPAYENIQELRKFLHKYISAGNRFETAGPMWINRGDIRREDAPLTIKESGLAFDDVDFLSDALYTLLTSDKWYRCKIMSTVYNAANRVVRNYREAGLVEIGEGILQSEYIILYCEAKGLRVM